jgi:HD superfamily phosphodiesterase/predicted RNA-binding Zn-ribbon protein involved in translation (DUF1610 family)
MFDKCPGQDPRKVSAESLKCAACGYAVEVFSDELRRRCPRCGAEVTRTQVPSCIGWCRAAKECVGHDAYARYVQNAAVSLKEKLVQSLREHFGKDARRIAHALRVAEYAQELLRAEGGDWQVVVTASILHDVGIKAAEEKYGSAAGHYQEELGPEIARAIMRTHGMQPQVIDEVCAIIGKHHTPRGIDSKNFTLVCDADWLVNLHDDIADRAARADAAKKVLITETAKALAKNL